MSATKTQPNWLGWFFFFAVLGLILWSCRLFFDYGDLFAQLSGKPLLERGRIGSSEWQSFLSRSGRGYQHKNYAKAEREINAASEGGTRPVEIIYLGGAIIIVNPNTREPSQRLEAITVVRSARDLPPQILAQGGRDVVTSVRGLRSGVAEGWVSVMQIASNLPPDAKVYLNSSSSLFFYYGTTYWFPCRVDVNVNLVGIRDDETLRQNAVRMDASQNATLSAHGYTHRVEVTPRGLVLEKIIAPVEPKKEAQP